MTFTLPQEPDLPDLEDRLSFASEKESSIEDCSSTDDETPTQTPIQPDAENSNPVCNWLIA